MRQRFVPRQGFFTALSIETMAVALIAQRGEIAIRVTAKIRSHRLRARRADIHDHLHPSASRLRRERSRHITNTIITNIPMKATTMANLISAVKS